MIVCSRNSSIMMGQLYNYMVLIINFWKLYMFILHINSIISLFLLKSIFNSQCILPHFSYQDILFLHINLVSRLPDFSIICYYRGEGEFFLCSSYIQRFFFLLFSILLQKFDLMMIQTFNCLQHFHRCEIKISKNDF